MKYYGVSRKRVIEKMMYYFVKAKEFCLQYTTLNNKKREMRKYIYNHTFVNPYSFHNRSCKIPEGKYYEPICIITCDLILRENISELKTGVVKLIKKYYSHKFLGGQHSFDEIIENIEHMDDTLGTWYNSIRVGRCDFENDSKLKQLISYFDVHIRNVNSSYLALEFHLYLTDNYRNKQMNIINNDYKNVRGYVQSSFTANSRTNGGKKTYGICHFYDKHLKSDLIYENISKLKWRFFNKINVYFPTILHKKGINPPSVNIYKTNINYRQKDAQYFWDSVGVSSYQGQFIDESRKIFFQTNLSGRYANNKRTDLIYIVNDLTMRKAQGYYSVDFQIVCEIEEDISGDIFKFTLLNALNDLVANSLIAYKLKLNKIKLRKNKLSKLLKLRYLYERDMDFYKRYVNDDIWNDAKKEIAYIFNEQKLKYSYDYRFLTDGPIASKNKIMEQINVLCKEFDEKTSVLQHLASYKNEKKDRRINIVMLILTVATVVFLIFPDLSKNIGVFLANIWCSIKNIFIK